MEKMKDWKLSVDHEKEIMIIEPMSDLQEHKLEDWSCYCNPNVLHVGDYSILVHNAFDRRETFEQINEILK